MSRIRVPARDEAPAASQGVLDAVAAQLGVVPNLFRLASISPAALKGMTDLSSALSTALDVKMRERIAIAVAQANGCSYCLSAHTYLGLNLAKLSPEEVVLNRRGASSDAKANAIVRFAVKVADRRGAVADADLDAVKAAGVSEAEIVEITVLVALNFLTNLLNNVAKTDIDFPVVDAAHAL